MNEGKMKEEPNGEILVYQNDDGSLNLDVRLQGETLWLNQLQLVELYQSSKANVSEHIKNIFEEGELTKETTVRNFRTVQIEGSRQVTRNVEYYNLDMIISLGYRIKSSVATKFRQWATARLKEYIVKGFALDDNRLKKLGGGNYWKELLDRIRDIRSSEKVMYRQVLNLYATSSDYNPKAAETIAFFKMVQNKLHYAAHGQTAAEVIYNRADSKKPFMGLKSFTGDFPIKQDVLIAKNYLDENELKILNNIVSGYFDFAENMAIEHTKVYMADYVKQLDRLLTADGRKLLEGAGTVSHKQAVNKAEAEFRKYEVENLSPVENEYLENVKALQKQVKKKAKSR